MQKVTLTLEEEILKFVDRRAKGNRSAYINLRVIRGAGSTILGFTQECYQYCSWL